MRVTAETITGAQIRELSDWRAIRGDSLGVTECFQALGPSDMFWSWDQPTPEQQAVARVRCAVAWNAIHGGQP